MMLEEKHYDYVNNVLSKPSVVAKPRIVTVDGTTTVTVDGMRIPIITPRGMLGLGVVGFAVDVLTLWRQYEEMLIQDKKRLQQEAMF